MRAILPYIFWPWFATSCFILLRRRVSTGGWRPLPKDDDVGGRPEFPPPPAADSAPSEPVIQAPAEGATQPEPAAAAVAVETAPQHERSRSLAEALEGIAMPCDLSPLIGDGAANPREIAFFTNGFDPAVVGTALGDELERLGYALTPVDDSSIRADRGQDQIRARIMGGELTTADVMQELHPSAPAGAIVVELKLT